MLLQLNKITYNYENIRYVIYGISIFMFKYKYILYIKCYPNIYIYRFNIILIIYI